MIDALIRLIMRQRNWAAQSGNRLACVYIGQIEAETIRREARGLSGWVHNARYHREDNEPEFVICDCPIYVLQNVKNHVGISIIPKE